MSCFVDFILFLCCAFNLWYGYYMRGKQAINFVKLRTNLWMLFSLMFIVILSLSLLWKRSIQLFWAARPPVLSKFFIFLSPPDTCNSQVDLSNSNWSPDSVHVCWTHVKLKIHFDAVTIVDQRENESWFSWQKWETVNYFILLK